MIERLFAPILRSAARLTPAHAVSAARCALFGGGALLAVFMVVPQFQGLEASLAIPWDKAAHFIAFYGLTALALAAYPKVRRGDMVYGVLAFGLWVELLQALFGRQAGLADMLANTLGALAVVGPSYLERLRTHARRSPDESFAAIAEADPRARRPAAAARPALVPDPGEAAAAAAALRPLPKSFF